MKKIGLLSLAIVLALGALGVGYASWTDTIFIDGTVTTGDFCLSIEDGTYAEVITGCDPTPFADYPDRNWAGWVQSTGVISCPAGYKFASKFCVDKDVGYVTFNPVEDGNGNIVELEVTLHDAYPHYLAWITFEVCNCGTVPLKLRAPVINQSNFLLIEYRNGVGTQLEPGECHEISLFIGVVQHEGHWVDGVWVVDDDTQDILPQNAGGSGANDPPALTFTITVEGYQWDE
jgi:hypothetical protein